MGRRKGFLATMVREMEKANQRAVAEARRQQRQVQAAHVRAVEREMVRAERAAERERIRAERDAERRRLEWERTNAVRTKQAEKQAAKDAQLRAWKLEFEAHQERETDIDRIGNDAPEVEDRDQMYAALGVRRAFEPEAFAPPLPHRSDAEAHAIHAEAAARLHATMTAFHPNVRKIRQAQAIGGAVAALGLLLMFVSGAVGLLAMLGGGVVIAVGHGLAGKAANEQRHALEVQTQQNLAAWTRERVDFLMRKDADLTQQALQRANADYAARMDFARRQFDAAEEERLRALAELHGGSVQRMKSVLEEALDLELPVPCPAAFMIESSSAVSIELSLPGQDVLPTDESKLLASGKVTYKAKPEKKLREQYQRMIAGLALRFASEAMLNLPSCTQVAVRAMLTDLDPSTGAPGRRCVLAVTYDFATLAPMTMDGIDPVAALKRFPHEFGLERGRELRLAHA